MDIIKIKGIRALLSSRWFPLVLQVMTLAAFGLLIAGGIGVSTDDANLTKELRNTNLANLLVWCYWWPLIIMAAILLGRIWCTACPVELASYLASRIGLRLKVPRLFKSGWVITIFYALILIIGVHTLEIHRIPNRMAMYLLMLFTVAVITGLIYEKRAFCSYICPVGHLLGLYAAIAPLEWRADDTSICKGCRTKDCIAKRNRYLLAGRSCTSNLYPATIKDNRDCILCTQCFKACPFGNLRLSTRPPLVDFFRGIELRAAQIGFILLLSGFVIYEILSEWPVSKTILTYVPNYIDNALRITGPLAAYTSAAVMFIIFPACLFLAVVALARRKSDVSSITLAKGFALLLLPTMAAAHLIKAIVKMTSRFSYWPYAISDPAGIETARKILDKEIVIKQSLGSVFDALISFAFAGLLVIALGATLSVFRKSPNINRFGTNAKVVLFLGMVIYWGIFALTVFGWRF